MISLHDGLSQIATERGGRGGGRMPRGNMQLMGGELLRMEQKCGMLGLCGWSPTARI